MQGGMKKIYRYFIKNLFAKVKSILATGGILYRVENLHNWKRHMRIAYALFAVRFIYSGWKG
ncbi:hypothetical protein D7V82_18215 [bacterium 1xD8-6]|nr:hypothetical protein D7V72_19350 [bacterium D16-36]RKI64538.1 hypothetical protein D7V82_18215 [bacterium 1xD8-6]